MVRARKLTKEMCNYWRKRDKEVADSKKKREKLDKEMKKRQQEEEEAFELSASQTAARQVRYMQEEMSRLKKENKAMRNEKLDVEAIYQQLVSEQKHEKFVN